MKTKTVIVKTTMRLTMEVPTDADEEEIQEIVLELEPTFEDHSGSSEVDEVEIISAIIIDAPEDEDYDDAFSDED